MNPHHGREFACPQVPVMPVILRGGAWTARRIRNNCLRQHCHVLATTFRRADVASLKPVCARVFHVLETRSRILTEIHPTELAVVAAVVRLGAYEDQWLRQPEDWRPEPNADAQAQWAALLRHLLARYPVPTFLDAVWELKGALVHFERDCWCALGYGRSLRQVAHFPRSVSNRVLHTALTSDGNTTLAEAIWMAQLRWLSASPALEAAVLGSRARLELGDHALWVRLAEKFAAGSESVAGQFGFVADALVAVREHRGAAQIEPLLRLPLGILIRHCLNFITSLLQANGHVLTEEQVRGAAAKAQLGQLAATRWQPLLAGTPFASKCGRAHGHAPWRVEELCSVQDLKSEGLAMEHCVARYAWRCRKGSSAIFSVRHCKIDRAGEEAITSCATVEVHSRTRKVVQIRAWRNRLVNHTIMTIINEWAEAHGLVMTK